MSDTSSPNGWFARLFKRRPETDNLSEDELQKKMMSAAERFHLLRVDDVMVPRADIVAVDNSVTLTELSLA